MDPQVRVGVGVFCFKRTGDFIIGKRKGSLGAGTYALPGGHLEFGETFEQCAAREVLEETGITISEGDIKYLTCVNGVFPEGFHYVTIAMGVLLPSDVEPQVCWFH
jgi:8-oxo-dGTP diphosphatase